MALRGMPSNDVATLVFILIISLFFFSLKKYVSMNELRGATTPQSRIRLLTKGSALLFFYSEPVEPFGDALYAEG